MRGGRVAQVGSSAELRKLAAGARVLDGRGGTLRPGARQGGAGEGEPPPIARGEVADFVLLDRAPAPGDDGVLAVVERGEVTFTR